MTRALILAAGQGTRLRPLTNNQPKCLVPFAGRPLLAHQTESLRAAGTENIHVVGGYRADQIAAQGYACTDFKGYAETNMVGTLFYARDLLPGDDDLIIAYGDIIYTPENLAALLSCDAPIGLMIDMNWQDYWSMRFEDPLSDAETLKFDPSLRLTEIGKKPNSFDDIQGQYTGLIKIRADFIAPLIQFYDQLDQTRLYDGQPYSNMYLTSLLQMLIDAQWHLQAVPVRAGWLEVDSVADLELYESLHQVGALSPFYPLKSAK